MGVEPAAKVAGLVITISLSKLKTHVVRKRWRHTVKTDSDKNNVFKNICRLGREKKKDSKNSLKKRNRIVGFGGTHL